MSYGTFTEKPCPSCGRSLEFVDYTDAPPPIPPPRGGYASLNGFVSDEGRRIFECPVCECDLSDAA